LSTQFGSSRLCFYTFTILIFFSFTMVCSLHLFTLLVSSRHFSDLAVFDSV
jgi:hypothetical protein